MAANLCVGMRVQGVDEIGRWAEGRIVQMDLNSAEVKFTGWDQRFNRIYVLPSVEVRAALPPVEEQGRSKWNILLLIIII